MIPGNVDPRRAEKVQRYKPPQANNSNAPVEDLTPDYMNILGPDAATTANADGIQDKTSPPELLHLPLSSSEESGGSIVAASSTSSSSPPVSDAPLQTSNGTNVIPTSPQYGVAIINNHAGGGGGGGVGGTDALANDTQTPTSIASVDEAAANKSHGLHADAETPKDAAMHSTPSRNDRFKVVKIASLEPFRRGRWKCMDYVDENPPPTQQGAQQTSKQTQSATSIQQMSALQYLQTQSLPQQHFQQMLVQGAFAAGSPQAFYQSVPTPMMPQSQYFYPAPTTVNLQQVPVQTAGGPASIQPAFINANQQYFATTGVPAGGGYATYSNVQYAVPPNLIQTQSSAFVPTAGQSVPTATQLPANFQQSQTYAGQPSSTQQQQQQQQQPSQPMVNGHAFPSEPPGGGGGGQPSQQQTQQIASSLPTQIAKNVILAPAATITSAPMHNQNAPAGVVQPTQYNPSSYAPANASAQAQTNLTQVTQVTPTILAPPPATAVTNQNPAAISFNQMQITTQAAPAAAPPYDLITTANVYTNPQFIAAAAAAAAAESSSVNDGQGDGSVPTASDPTNSAAAPPENQENASGEDPAKANPVVNAIDNKIEQAMDLVKSHLMYTVREEVEVLKEKIVELMERIQQLETENAYLKQQISKGAGGSGAAGAGAGVGGSSSAGATNGGTPTPQQQQQQQGSNSGGTPDASIQQQQQQQPGAQQ